MGEVWNLDSLIGHLGIVPENYDDFMDALLKKCWDLRSSKRVENNKALGCLYDIQCGYHKFAARSAGIAKVFNVFFEDIARCGPACLGYLHFDPHRYLNVPQRERFDKELERRTRGQDSGSLNIMRLREHLGRQYPQAAWGGPLTIENLKARYRILSQAFKQTE